MGGCRCHFRDCHVTTAKFPRMHFFRFPFKDIQRYEKWRQMAKIENTQLSSEVRRNTSICARHFRIECFMNYKMERITPNAVPTLMRLSEDKALDFELDIENGVLITIEKSNVQHLIAPTNFESPLQFENDKISREKLNELEDRKKLEVTQNFCAEVPLEAESSYEYTVTKPCRSLVKSVEIIKEAVEVRAPNNIKRFRNLNEELFNEAEFSNKKCRLLNATNCYGKKVNATSIVENSETERFDINEYDEVEEFQEIVNSGEEEGDHLFVTPNDFITVNSSQVDDNDIEFVEKPYDDITYEMPINDADHTIVELKSYVPVDSSILEANNEKILALENELTDLRQKCEEINALKANLSILETENLKLKEIAKEKEQLNKKLLNLQIENNRIKKSLQNNETLNDKLLKYTEENKRLQDEVSKCDILKAELLSRQEETKELKKLLETLKNNEGKEMNLRKQLDTLKKDSLNEIETLKQELKNVNKTLEFTQQQLKNKELELKDIQLEFNSLKNEKENLKQLHEELQQTLNNIQNNFDIKKNDYRTLKTDYDNLQQKYLTIEQKYWKLQALQNQEATVSTSNKPATPANHTTPTVSANSLTKAQLFNGIKRYLSASMVSLLRMEMFGSSEREWKTDERQVAVDILRLGETVYKYFTDEWRFRLPSLRDVRNWLSQSEQMMDDEEDL